MHTLTPDDLTRQPRQLLDDAARGEASLVMQDGQAVLLAVPLGAGLDSSEARCELAVRLFDLEQVSLGVAAQIAGLCYGDMVNELGRRGLAVIRTNADELERELVAFGQ